MVDLANLKDENEDVRRLEIIDASKDADPNSIETLLEIFDTETTANKRHIVRALGNIGGEKAEDKLLDLIETESGEILGDVCKSLGQLKSVRAKSILLKLLESEMQWVSQNARWALKQYENDS